MIEAYKKYFSNYANFNGRSTKSDYWYVVLANILIGLVLGLFGEFGTKLSLIYSIVTFIPGIAVFVRRMHDINKSGWTWLWGLIPFVGWIILLVFLCKKSVDEGNKYGPSAVESVVEATTEENA